MRRARGWALSRPWLLVWIALLGWSWGCRRAPAERKNPERDKRITQNAAPSNSSPRRRLNHTPNTKPAGPVKCRNIQMMSPTELLPNNVDPDKLSQFTNQVIALVGEQLKQDKTRRDVAISMVLLPQRQPDFHVAARPALNPARRQAFLAKLSAIEGYRPNHIALPFVLYTCVHGGAEDRKAPFVPKMPEMHWARFARLEKKPLDMKLEAIRDWAWRTLPVLAGALKSVSPEFQGVRQLGSVWRG